MLWTFSCLSEWALWSPSTFLPGFKISPVFVSHSSLTWPPLFSRRSASALRPRNKSKALLDARAQAVWSAHSCIPAAYPCQARECWADRRRSVSKAEQTNVPPSESVPTLVHLHRKPGRHLGSAGSGISRQVLPHVQDS